VFDPGAGGAPHRAPDEGRDLTYGVLVGGQAHQTTFSEIDDRLAEGVEAIRFKNSRGL
jgi:hypothetical protein